VFVDKILENGVECVFITHSNKIRKAYRYKNIIWKIYASGGYSEVFESEIQFSGTREEAKQKYPELFF